MGWLDERIRGATDPYVKNRKSRKRVVYRRGWWLPGAADHFFQFRLRDEKDALKWVRARVKKDWPVNGRSDWNPFHIPVTKPRRVVGDDVRYYNPFRPRPQGIVERTSYVGGKMLSGYYLPPYYSDGSYLIMVDKMPKTRYPFRSAEPTLFDNVLWDARVAKGSVEIVAELCFEDDRVLVDAHRLVDGEHWFYNAKYIDSILTLHPKAKTYTTGGKHGALVFKVDAPPNVNVVGVVMPCLAANRGGFVEWYNTYATERYQRWKEAKSG